MGNISSHQSGISHQELKAAIPESLLTKNIHLHWIDRSRSGDELYTLTAKIEIDGQIVLLRSKTTDKQIIDN